ncbi:MAG: cytochrome C oxidase subunit III, partial [Gelidibacter sp.]
HTVSEGGRSGKGMIAWKAMLKPVEMAQVSSYLMTFEGTTPANPKEPEGDIWTDQSASE